MDSRLARALNANMVIGTEEACKIATQEILGRPLSPVDVKDIPVQEQVDAWFQHGELGLSSKVMACKFTGNIGPASNHPEGYPSDPSDLRRCMLLLEWAPGLRLELHQMRCVSIQWQVLIKHWEELEMLLTMEMPKWKEPNRLGSAPRCLQRMKELLSTKVA